MLDAARRGAPLAGAGLLALWALAALAGEPDATPLRPPQVETGPRDVYRVLGGAVSMDWTRDGAGFVVGGVGHVTAWTRGGGARWTVPLGRGHVRVTRTLHQTDRVLVANDHAQVRILDLVDGSVAVDLGTLGTGPDDPCQQPHETLADQGSFARRWCGDKPEWVMAGAVSPDDRFVAVGGIAGSVAVFDVLTGQRQLLPTLPVRPSRIEDVAFSPDGQLLAVAGTFEGTPAVVYDLGAHTIREVPWVPRKGCARGQAVDISPDGQHLAIGCWGGVVEVQTIPLGTTVWSDTPGLPNWSGPLTFTADGGALLVRTPKKLHRYDVVTGAHLERDLEQSADMRLSPDGTTLAVPMSAGGGELHLIEASTLRAEPVRPARPVPEEAQPEIRDAEPATLGPILLGAPPSPR